MKLHFGPFQTLHFVIFFFFFLRHRIQCKYKTRTILLFSFALNSKRQKCDFWNTEALGVQREYPIHRAKPRGKSIAVYIFNHGASFYFNSCPANLGSYNIRYPVTLEKCCYMRLYLHLTWVGAFECQAWDQSNAAKSNSQIDLLFTWICSQKELIRLFFIHKQTTKEYKAVTPSYKGKNRTSR